MKVKISGSILVLALLSALVWAYAGKAGITDQPTQVAAADLCPSLPPPTGNTVNVATVDDLRNAVNNATPGDTILIADGDYPLNGVYLRIDTPDVTLRSHSGNREAVVLDGNYQTTEIIQIVASNVTIADLTLREAYNHPIHVTSRENGDTLNTLIYNVHIVDPGEQAIKINPYTGENALYFPDDGTIACSHIELTDAGRQHIRNDCYTGGVDAHQAEGWVIRDNRIEGFWCASGLSEHGIHLWRSCRDTLVARNLLMDNVRGIGFGLVTSGDGVRTYPDDPCPSAEGGYVDHYGGIIRNNFVFANDGGLFASQYGFDCGICLWNACGAQVVHNTVASTQAPFSSIEWRFDHTLVDLTNNLVSHNLNERDGSATLAGNLENAPLSLFVDGANGDLHLAASANAAIDQGVAVAPGLCDDDVDGDARPIGSARDIGADEYGTSTNQPPYEPGNPSPPDGATDVSLSQALAWSGGDPDGDVVTYTVALGTDSPPPVVATTAATGYAPDLQANTTYYWRIAATDGAYTSTGSIWTFGTAGGTASFSGPIAKSVTPQGQVHYGDELTYTLIISAETGTQIGLYDPLEGSTWLRFVGQPPAGITHAADAVTGTLTVTPANQVTLRFVVRVDVPGTVGVTTSVTNAACVYVPGGTLGDCVWSIEVSNEVLRPYSLYLPLTLNNR